MAGEYNYTVRTGTKVILPPDTDVPALGADPARIGLIWSMNSALATIWVIATGWSEVPFRCLMPSSGYVEFTYSRHGPLVAGDWWVRHAAGPNIIYWAEILVAGGRPLPTE